MRSPSRPFSIRPTEVKRFRTVLRDVDLSLRVLASLRNRPYKPFHDGIRRTKWNNLQGVLCAHEAQGTAHAPNSLRPLVPRGTTLRLNAEPQTSPPGPFLYYRTNRQRQETQIARNPALNPRY